MLRLLLTSLTVSVAWGQSSAGRRLLQACSTLNYCQVNKLANGGPYVDPCDKRSFIQCSNGLTYVTQCGPGLVYDPTCSCCNYPSPAGPASPTPSLPPSTPKPPPPTTPPAASPPPPVSKPPPPSTSSPLPPKSPLASPPPPVTKAPSPPPSPVPSTPAAGKVKSAYWGQGAASSTLASICAKYDIIFLSFLPNFGMGQDVTSNAAINIAGHSLTQTAADISTCQGQGKKIILSIGGGVGNYGFSSTADAQSTAGSVWKAYLGGSGTNRPFGSVVLDGVDLDVETPAGAQYYSDFVKALKGLYGQSSKKFLLTAVPQCPFPDNNLGPKAGTALGDTASSFDYVSIQFYNNPSCGGSNTVSGYGPWKTWAQSSGVKLLPTFPAAARDAGSGYQVASAVAAELNQLKSDPTYGGWNLFTAEDDSGFSSQLPS